jgi:hypothetical protein
MNRAEFNAAFESEFLNQLKPAGFAVSGKHVFYRDEVNMTSLIRLGGKYALLPSVTWVLCFRHTFLRNNKDVQIPKGVGDVFDYPFKFCPEALIRIPSSKWSYMPRNLNYDREEFAFEKESNVQVAKRLNKLADFLVSEFLPWTRTMTPDRARKEIIQHGEQAWIEKIWLEDYDNFLNGKVSP